MPRGQKYFSPGRISVEGDWSNAAFFLAAGAIGKTVEVCGLDMNSPQGDKAIVEILKRFGARVNVDGDCIRVSPAPLKACRIDVSEAPDLLPILCVVAACAEGQTGFVNAARLRLKESDRLRACADMLRVLGISVNEYDDALFVTGGDFTGGTVDSVRDHRIVMSAAVAAIRCKRSVLIKDAQAVRKSYPSFFEDYKKLGGEVYVV